jgi:hypothetical protein
MLHSVNFHGCVTLSYNMLHYSGLRLYSYQSSWLMSQFYRSLMAALNDDVVVTYWEEEV